MMAAASSGGGGGATCTATVASPGSLGPAFGAEAMAVDEQTVTQDSGGTQQAAEIGPYTFPAVGEAVVFEAHYDPADWSGGSNAANFVAVGDLSSGASNYIGMDSSEAQSNSVLVFAAINDSVDGKTLAIYEQDGTVFNSFQSSPSEVYGQVGSNVGGASLTFVTDPSQFQGFANTPLASDPDFAAYDVCGNTI
jgi:hypothetical protein